MLEASISANCSRSSLSFGGLGFRKGIFSIIHRCRFSPLEYELGGVLLAIKKSLDRGCPGGKPPNVDETGVLQFGPEVLLVENELGRHALSPAVQSLSPGRARQLLTVPIQQ